jgi:hypothetical protein
VTRFAEILPPKNDAFVQATNNTPEKKNEAITSPVEPETTTVVPAVTMSLHDDATAKECWDAMAGRLPGMAATQVTLVYSVRFVAPDTVVVAFPSTQPLAKSYCENESQKIQTILRELSGQPIRLRFETVMVEEPKKPSAPQINPAKQKMQLMAQASDHPMVKKAAELFGATLTDVKPG